MKKTIKIFLITISFIMIATVNSYAGNFGILGDFISGKIEEFKEKEKEKVRKKLFGDLDDILNETTKKKDDNSKNNKIEDKEGEEIKKDVQKMFDGLVGEGKIKVDENGVDTSKYVEDTMEQQTKNAIDSVTTGGIVGKIKNIIGIKENVEKIKNKNEKEEKEEIKETKKADKKSTKQSSKKENKENNNKKEVEEKEKKPEIVITGKDTRKKNYSNDWLKESGIISDYSPEKPEEDNRAEAIKATDVTKTVNSLLTPTIEELEEYESKYLNGETEPINFCLVCGVPTWRYGEPDHCDHQKYIYYNNKEYIEDFKSSNGRLRFKLNIKKYKKENEEKFTKQQSTPRAFCADCGYIWWGSIDEKTECDCHSYGERNLYSTFKHKKELIPFFDNDGYMRFTNIIMN